MKKIFLIPAGLIFLTVFAATASAAIKEGQWSMTMTTKVEGMSAENQAAMKELENMPPETRAMMEKMQGRMGVKMGMGADGMTTTVTQCMTGSNPVPNPKTAENCKETHDISGDTVNFHVTCDSRAVKVDSTGHVTYMGDSMQGEIKSRQEGQGVPSEVNIKISGKYMGPCP